ncbi:MULTISPECIES: flagellar hook-basal body complex protein FliE [unclassified Arthrobacter]|uniref:flagellar hook-basal body complex protein FliE n=1 Tax=unclassified Arthrobacter TaxID=235627 RepID=UPI001E61F278|nr:MULTISPECIES: flagellar hook-basal body complex protein FliE [unclassified Arthrobacter]MCC9146677.1 flagellar hook-basal body complex protein FliE [Arthrobacter sp. zg-Y919]MDK1277907.1 flagellar hook-basal body complex protein FliE [Arthrobacter sp. zg.Y919]MDM7990878.1 flagellar hook-basal body complex protein FliE [Arthrobacter sp. zg-Y877]WIB03499.1 flagellar hook-basal body complex protein FliE [Arthrobacter sp. zg-Y919]
MPVPAIAAVSSTTPTGYVEAPKPAVSTDGSSFATQLTGAVDNVTELQSTSKTLAVQAVTGDLDDIHAATIASTRASVTLELVAAVRNKGVDAFNEIMRMQA